MNKKRGGVLSFLLVIGAVVLAVSAQTGASGPDKGFADRLAVQANLIRVLESRVNAMERSLAKAQKAMEAPLYDSGWFDMEIPGMPHNISHRFDHFLAGKGYADVDNYVVDLQFKDEAGNINNWYYGGDRYHDAYGEVVQEGAYWTYLTTSSITVTRNLNDTQARWTRVRIWAYK